MSGSTGDSGDLNSGLNGVTDIAVDAAGNPYLTGSFSGNNFLSVPVTGVGKTDIFIARLNPVTGAPVWVQDVGSDNYDAALGLALDNAGNAYILGDILGATEFPTLPDPVIVSLDGYEDTVICKYDPTGQIQWVTSVGDTGDCYGNNITVNQAGQVYVSGESDDPVTFGPFSLDGDGFVAKLDSDGQTWLWAKGFSALGERVTLDGSGNPYITGEFFTSAAFGSENPSTAQTIDSSGEEDQYLAKYDAAGNFQFARAIVSDGNESENLILSANVNVDVIPIRLVLNPLTGAMHVSGDFTGALTVDDVKLDAGENRDGFIAGLDEGFSLSSGPSSQAIGAGQSASFTVKVLSSLASGTSAKAGVTPQSLMVDLSASVSPSNGSITTSFLANQVALAESTTLTVTAAPTTPQNTYTITISGTNGQTVQTNTVTVVVSGPDYSLGFQSPSVTVQRGVKTPLTVLINRIAGFAGNVTVTPPAPANGIKVKPNAPMTTGGNSVAFKVKVGAGVAPGSYQRTFTAQDDSGRTRTATITMIVQ